MDLRTLRHICPTGHFLLPSKRGGFGRPWNVIPFEYNFLPHNIFGLCVEKLGVLQAARNGPRDHDLRAQAPETRSINQLLEDVIENSVRDGEFVIAFSLGRRSRLRADADTLARRPPPPDQGKYLELQ